MEISFKKSPWLELVCFLLEANGAYRRISNFFSFMLVKLNPSSIGNMFGKDLIGKGNCRKSFETSNLSDTPSWRLKVFNWFCFAGPLFGISCVEENLCYMWHCHIVAVLGTHTKVCIKFFYSGKVTNIKSAQVTTYLRKAKHESWYVRLI